MAGNACVVPGGALDEEFLKRRRKLCDTIVVPPGNWLDGVLQGDGLQPVASKRQRVAASAEECLAGACRTCVGGARAMGRCPLCAGLPDDDLRKWFYAEKACSGPDPFDQPRKSAESVVEVCAFADDTAHFQNFLWRSFFDFVFWEISS